jgi:hypothetical protein
MKCQRYTLASWMIVAKVIKCLDDWERGADPAFPISWRIKGHSVLSFYRCGQCGQTWHCWWNRDCVTEEAKPAA